jgi:hypothetical protein
MIRIRSPAKGTDPRAQTQTRERKKREARGWAGGGVGGTWDLLAEE